MAKNTLFTSFSLTAHRLLPAGQRKHDLFPDKLSLFKATFHKNHYQHKLLSSQLLSIYFPQ